MQRSNEVLQLINAINKNLCELKKIIQEEQKKNCVHIYEVINEGSIRDNGESHTQICVKCGCYK